MIYIFETELNNEKSIYFSLINIYGLGSYQAKVICKKLGFSKNLITSKMTNEQIIKLIKSIEKSNLMITSELKKYQIFTLKNLVDIKCYSGLRRIKGLPVRGQRTHTNARTSKKFYKINT